MSRQAGGLRGVWRRVTRLGVDQRASPLESRHVVVVNTLTVLAITASILIAPYDLERNFSPALLTLHVGVIAVYSSILALNARGHTTAASVLLLTGVIAGTISGVLIQGPESGVHFGFLVEILCAYLVFHHRMRWLALFFAAAAGALFVVTSIAALEVPGDEIAADAEMFRSTTTQVAVLIFVMGFLARRIATTTEARMDTERRSYGALLRSIYPPTIADRLANGCPVDPTSHPHVCVISCDIVGFTKLAEQRSPEETVQLLDELFSAFDARCLDLGVEKITTVGDGYVAAAGLWSETGAGERAVALARAMLAETATVSQRHEGSLRVRIGIGVGVAISGVVGQHKATFDLWGEATSRAHEFERAAEPGTILVDAQLARLSGVDGDDLIRVADEASCPAGS